ncbi:hypothetical protein GCM10011415_01820 [Salipiger pallidus]|uniref:Uncharacterized protein n=1 Tax=Salipiger pallidus TaxID=1775170 RepID=A0A8J3EDF7_9RHOB|nr:solute carrier family 23 protein [Salipiger pallidus]GGG59579.1 hypothetical protein GCM10011415_01820 [Salipiger pallidus]
MQYGVDFDLAVLIHIAFIAVVTTNKTSGNLTANPVISDQPVRELVYSPRIKGGILADGINSGLAALFKTLPNITFLQNSGVIQMTGVASRHVGHYIAVFLVLPGHNPREAQLRSVNPKTACTETDRNHRGVGAPLPLQNSISTAARPMSWQ